MSEDLSRRDFLGTFAKGLALVLSGCAGRDSNPQQGQHRTRQTSFATIDQLVAQSIEDLRHEDYAAVRDTLKRCREKFKHENDYKFLTALAYGAECENSIPYALVAGKALSDLIDDFEDNPRMIAALQRDFAPVFALQAYATAKRKFWQNINRMPEKITPLYGFLCVVEQDYEGAAWALGESIRKWYGHKKDSYSRNFHTLLGDANQQRDFKRASGYVLLLSAMN